MARIRKEPNRYWSKEERENTQIKWVCSVCGYIHYGDNPPEKCPLCGVPKELFNKD